jgi:DNA-binding NtrC family response regulator
MNPAAVIKERFERNHISKSVAKIGRDSGNPTVLIATVEPEIREGLSSLLETLSVNAMWVASVADVRTLIGKEKIAACLCGFWLQDGTYREVIRTLRRERIEIPAIIVSAPACPHEYGEYLAALNIGVFDFLRFPYQRSDFERILESAIDRECPSTQIQA